MCKLNGIIVIIIITCALIVQWHKAHSYPMVGVIFFFKITFVNATVGRPVGRYLSDGGAEINQKYVCTIKKNKNKTKAGTRKVALIHVRFFFSRSTNLVIHST
jgi:hypothetical protein